MGVLVRAEGCRNGDARPARLLRRGREVKGLSRCVCDGRQQQQASGSRGGAWWRAMCSAPRVECGVDITESALRKSRRAVRGQYRTPAEEELKNQVYQLAALLTGLRHSRRATRLWSKLAGEERRTSGREAQSVGHQ